MKYEKPVISRQNPAVEAICSMQKGTTSVDHDSDYLATSGAYEADE